MHEKYSHGSYRDRVLDLVWTHSLIVEEVSLMLVENLTKKYPVVIDIPLVRVGAWVHDVGFYNCFDDKYEQIKKYILHSLEGYTLLKSEGMEEKVARFALVHTGVGVNSERAAEAGLPLKRSYVPVTMEEEIVTYADSFHTKAHVRFLRYKEIQRRLLEKRPEDSPILNRFREKYGVPDINPLENKYKKWQKAMNAWAKETGNE